VLKRGPVRWRLAAAAPLACACAALAQEEPFFSVRNGGPSGLRGDFVFRVVGGAPEVVGGGPGMGLGRTGDEIQGLAAAIDPGRVTQDFIICFSVDPFAVGVARLRISGQNLFEQALNNQQPGDTFLSTEAFNRVEGLLPPPFSMGLENNALAVNQSEEYPNAFGLLPEASPEVFVPVGTALDDIDAAFRATPYSPPRVYFTLAGASLSHDFLPGPDSGATVFFDPDFQQGGDEQVYAPPSFLGLAPPDEIDGLFVFDDNLNGQYDGTDSIFFSLTPDSPTLQALGLSPGDVLVATQGALLRFANAGLFGMLATDNMDAMDMVPLVNGSAEDTINSMVDCPADFTGDGDIDTRDIMAFLNAWAARDPRADFNGDGRINTLDVLAFLNQWNTGC